jgi:hypothetical protein
MSVRKQSDVALDLARSCDDPIHPRTYLLRRLAAWTSVPEDQPAGRHLVDLLRRQPLVFAVYVGQDLKRPLPIRHGGRIDAELVGVLLTRDALVDQGFAHAGAGDTETGYPVNGIDG